MSRVMRVMCWHSFLRRRWINPRTSCLKKCFYFEAATGNMVFFFSPVASVLFVTSDFCFQILKNSPCSYRGNRKCHQTKQDWNPEDYNFYYSFREYAVLCSVNVFMCQGSGATVRLLQLAVSFILIPSHLHTSAHSGSFDVVYRALNLFLTWSGTVNTSGIILLSAVSHCAFGFPTAASWWNQKRRKARWSHLILSCCAPL